MTAPAAHASDHSGRGAAPHHDAPEVKPAQAVAEPKLVVPPTEKAKIRGEVDLKAFKVRDPIFYWQDGAWKAGIVDVPPAKERGVITMAVNEENVRLEVAPYRIEFPRSSVVIVGGKEYTVSRVYPAKNGAPLYDLVTADPADTKRGVDQETVKNWKTGGDKKAEVKISIEDSRGTIAETTRRLLAEVKRVQGGAALELVKSLSKLEQKVLDMEKALAETSEDEAGLKTAEKAVKDLRRVVELEMADLEKKIAAVIEEEKKVAAGKGKKEMADIVLENLRRKAEKIDSKVTKEYEADLRAWEDKAKKHADWEAEVKALEKKPKEGKDKDADKDADNEKLKQLKDKEPEKPGKKPELVKPSDAKKDELLAEVYRELPTQFVGKSELLAEFEELKKEVDTRRRAAAQKTGRDDFPNSTPEEGEEYKKENFKQFDAVVKDWTKLPEKVEPINLAEVKKELEAKVAELDTKAYDQGQGEIQKEIARVGVKAKAIAGTEEAIDAWHALGTIEIKLAQAATGKKEAKAEHKEAGEGEKEPAVMVDLPQPIVQEMLLANPEGIKAAMEEAYAALYTPESTPVKLEGLLRTFFRNIDIDAGPEKTLTLRQQLKQQGVENWESFLKRFEGPLAEKFAGVILEAAKAELRTLLSQKIGDIKKMVREERTWGEAFKDNIVDHSALAKMKGPVALRYLINTLLIGGTGVAAGLGANLIPFLPGGVKAAAVGGVVGFVKGIAQRFMGKDDSYFQKAGQRAKAEADADKKKLIADTLLKRNFKTKDDGEVELTNSVELSHFLAASLRRATEGDKPALKFADAAGEFELTGDAVCMYHEALRRAADTEGLEVEEKTRLEFARALHALHNNKKAAVDTPPLLARGLQWLTESYSGRTAVPKEEKNKKEGSTAPVGGWRQLGITTALGAGVAYAAFADGMAVRVGIGATYGVLHGQKAQFEADQRAGDRESRENLGTIVSDVSDLLKKGVKATKEELALARDYRDIIAALLGGGKFVLPEGKKLKDYDKEDARLIGWAIAHSHDAASFLQRDDKMRKVAESVQREIARSGFLERQDTELKTSFKSALDSMKNANERLGKEAKNSGWLEAGRFLKRGVRSVVYGGIGAGISYGIGKGVQAIKAHLAAPPKEFYVTPHKGTTDVVAPVKSPPVAPSIAPEPAHALPTPEHAPEFPVGSEVHAQDGITDPVSRQLFDKFKLDAARDHKPSITLENGQEYHFRGNIHNEKALNNFAIKVSAEMAKLKGDIDVSAGTEHRLENVGGHVVLTEHNGKFSYDIHGESIYSHKADYLHQPSAPEQAPHGAAPEPDLPTAPVEVPLESFGTHMPLPPTGSLVDRLHNPAAGGLVDLAPHPVAGTVGSSAPVISTGIDQVMQGLHEQAAEQALLDWAAHKSGEIHDMLEADLLTEDQLATWTKEFAEQHSDVSLKDMHEQLESFLDDKVVSAGSPAEGGIALEETTTAVPPAAPEEEIIAAPSAPAHEAVEMPVAETVVATANHPVVIEPQGNDRVIHFFDQKDHHEHTVAISEQLEPRLSGDAHDPLLVKLNASGNLIPAHLEMRSIPGKLDKEPVVVFENEDINEELVFRIIDKKLEKMELPPAS